MAENWQPGDLALCIKQDRWRYNDGVFAPGPRPGQIHTVRRTCLDITGSLTLLLEAFPGDWPGDGYCASKFRKITPEAEDRFDEEVIEALKSQPEPAEA